MTRLIDRELAPALPHPPLQALEIIGRSQHWSLHRHEPRHCEASPSKAEGVIPRFMAAVRKGTQQLAKRELLHVAACLNICGRASMRRSELEVAIASKLVITIDPHHPEADGAAVARAMCSYLHMA